MKHQTVTIINRLGLHARAAAKFVQTASAYQADIQVRLADRHADGKSIMSVMMLAASKGSEIQISIKGNDEEEAMAALEKLINDRFGETE